MPTTLNDIAKYTGLSIATVSKHINGIKIKEENQVIIDEAVKKLDYTVNEYARGLKINRSRTVGILVHALANIFMAEIVTQIEKVLRENNYSTVICNCNSDKKIEKEAVKFLMSKRVDAIINIPTDTSGAHLEPAIKQNLPILLIDRLTDNLKDKTDCVLLDNEKAAYEATELLINKGHKNIGIVVGPKEMFTSASRLNGYKKALIKANIPIKDDLIYYSDFDTEGGYNAVKYLCENNFNMTATFVTNYEMSLGAIIYANEKRIKIPSQLSIIAFDSMELTKIVNPKLTIVTQPLIEMANQGANIILKKLTNKEEHTNETVVLSATLVEGDSVADIRNQCK